MDKSRDWDGFCALLRAAAAVTGKKIEPDAVGLMFDLLAGYTAEQVRNAVAAHLKSPSGRFFPTPADITARIEGDEAERAAVAWRVFLAAVDRYGYYDSVRFPEAAYHYAVGLLGGWIKASEEFGAMSDRERNFRRAEFIALYRAGERKASFAPAPGRLTVAAYLPGAFERDNLAAGFRDAVPDVVEIGTGRVIRRAELAAGPENDAEGERPECTAELAAACAATKTLR